MECFAHVSKNQLGEWIKPHDLEDHLLETARLSSIFASKFSSEEWGFLIGRFHDVGKSRSVWQKYLVDKSGYLMSEESSEFKNQAKKIPHAIYAGKLFMENGILGLSSILAYIVSGHHSGLQDWEIDMDSKRGALKFQLNQCNDLDTINPRYNDFLRDFLSENKKNLDQVKKFVKSGMALSLWIRMLFSCLVDADWIDTEAYMGTDVISRGGYSNLVDLRKKYEKYMIEKENKAEKTPINELRKKIRVECETKANSPQGIFNLALPTGAGKTLTGMGFALKHAEHHQLDRIIYVSPYVSITEQTANVFRDIFGHEQVVEHHSNVSEEISTQKMKLATENWDCSIITTSSVQFFDSLFAVKPSKCRKLHNIASSVVILDETQLLPVEYLNPILETMNVLTEHFNVSFIISTATQPAFSGNNFKSAQFEAFKKSINLVGHDSQIDELFGQFKRWLINYPKSDEPMCLDELALSLCKHKKVLCIVNDRKSCKELFEKMPKGTHHLSGLMCGEHKSDKIEEIRKALLDPSNEIIRVVSTNLVEAGVDFDFPVVYKAFSGIDSIVQAAGRCNREGQMKQLGEVVVFNPPRKPYDGILRKSYDTTYIMYKMGMLEEIKQETFNIFFDTLYGKSNSLDSKGICELLDCRKRSGFDLDLYFKTASNAFNMIDDSGIKTVIVRYACNDSLIQNIKYSGPTKELMRKLQRYTVSIYDQDFAMLINCGAIEVVSEEIFVLTDSRYYHMDLGLLVEDHSKNPDLFIL